MPPGVRLMTALAVPWVLTFNLNTRQLSHRPGSCVESTRLFKWQELDIKTNNE